MVFDHCINLPNWMTKNEILVRNRQTENLFFIVLGEFLCLAYLVNSNQGSIENKTSYTYLKTRRQDGNIVL